MSDDPIIEIGSLRKQFGGLVAVNNVSININKEILGLIGPNGAGKTTLFHLIAGFHAPTSGKILFNGKDVTTASSHMMARLGLARTFQIVRPFTGLTLRENILVGLGKPYFSSLTKTWQKSATSSALAKVDELIEKAGLCEFTHSIVDVLPIGALRRLEIVRAIASGPQVLLIDEPAAGLTSNEASDLAAYVKRINAEGVAIVIVEHNVNFVMGLCDRIAVLHEGSVLAVGDPATVQASPAVRAAYLGGETNAA